MRKLHALLASLVLVAGLSGCGSGTALTTQGPRPAAEVAAQDATADVLHLLSGMYAQAVALHDARVGAEPADVHARNRATLLAFHDGLEASWSTLIVWKSANTGASPAYIVRALFDSVEPFLSLASNLGILSEKDAATVRSFVAAARLALQPSTAPATGRIVPLS
jgi:hypothetical protein